jgi:hypothetical protein
MEGRRSRYHIILAREHAYSLDHSMKCISVARIVDGFIDISDSTRYAEGSEVVIRLISLALVGDPLTGA